MRRRLLLVALAAALSMLLAAGCASGGQASQASTSESASSASSEASPGASKQQEGAFDPNTDEVLNAVADRAQVLHSKHLGYPLNEDVRLDEFYEWYRENGLDHVVLNNAGDPNEESGMNHGALEVEREVIRSFVPLYGFDSDDVWGLVSASGTDGNDHGIYFGRHYLTSKTALAKMSVPLHSPRIDCLFIEVGDWAPHAPRL